MPFVGLTVTVTVAVAGLYALFPVVVIVITVLPHPTGVTVPFADTVATLVSLET